VTKSKDDTYPDDLAGAPADPPTTAPADLIEAWRDFEEGERELLEDGGQLYAAGSWRMAPALDVLLAEANAANPRRDKRSDGGIGDRRHSLRKSKHNPDARGVVNARDFDVDGLDVAGAVERMRAKVAAGQLPQLEGGAIIYAARITRRDFAGWLEYEGDNPHVTHAHVELGTDRRKQDDGRPWNVWTAPAAPPARPAPAPPAPAGSDLRGRGLALRGEAGAQGSRVAALQSWLRTHYPLYARGVAVDGVWGPQTTGVLREFAHRSGVPSADGLNIGPRLAAQLHRRGFHG
jgi:hypothetical protein